MADEVEAEVQEDSPEEGQAPSGSEEGEEQSFDLSYVQKLRGEAARYRKEAQEARARVSEFEQAQLSETERLQAQLKEAQSSAEGAQQALQAAKAQAAIATAASKQGVDAALLARLVEVEFSDDGEPQGVDAAVAAVLTQYPQLKPSNGPQVPPTNPRRKSILSIDEVKQMSADEINRRWDEVSAALQG